MIPNLEVSYQRIANGIVECIPYEWEDALVTAIVYPESISFEGEFRTTAGEIRSLSVSMELNRAFRELREKFEAAGQPLWGQATFVLDSRGKFEMKWGYENCDENGDTIWDADQWRRRQEERDKRLGL
ncbi:immunity protein YezG family protein [Bremerella sp. JC770]|uniref:immunity protein YezG family protein n=1 Tax=Bremerella sp. JC770 TaxID=3232137 RepID=UPI003459F3CA